MATLSQQSLTNVGSAPSSSSGPSGSSTVISYHRRQSTLLLASPSQTLANSIAFSTVQRNDSGSWTSTCARPWSCPVSMIPLIGALPLEAMDAFMLIACSRKTTKSMLHVLSITGSLMCACSLSEASTFIACADFDQNRKDLLVALDGGRVQSYAIRMVSEGKGEHSREVVQAIFRRQMQLSKEAGKTPVQITAGDVSGAALLLSRGGITCLDSGSLDKLWFVPSSIFVMPPTQIWMDRFGSDFVVLCKSSSTSSGKQGETLEYWNAPTSFAQAEAGSFSRAVVPTTSSSPEASGIVDLALETVGGRHGTMLCLLLSSGKVQLWRPLRAQGELLLDSEVSLAGHFDFKPYAVSSRAVPIGPETTGTVATPGMPMLRRAPLPSRSIMQFVGSVGTPDCPLALLAACNSDVCSLALHAPQAVESACQRTLLDLSLMQHPDARGWDDDPLDYISRFQRNPILQAAGRKDTKPKATLGSPAMPSLPPHYISGGNDVYVLDDEDDPADNGFEDDNVSGLATVQGSKYSPHAHNLASPFGGDASMGSHHSVELRLPFVEGRAYTPSTRNASPSQSRVGTPSSGSPPSPGSPARGATGYLSVKTYEEFLDSQQQVYLPTTSDTPGWTADGDGGLAFGSLAGDGTGLEGSMAELFGDGRALSLDSLGGAPGEVFPDVPAPPSNIRVENSIRKTGRNEDNDNVSLGSEPAVGVPSASASATESHSQVAFESTVQTGQPGIDGEVQISINLPTTSINTNSLNTTSNILLDMSNMLPSGGLHLQRPPHAAQSHSLPAHDIIEKPVVSYFFPARLLPCLGAGSSDLPEMTDGLSVLRAVTPSLVALSHAVGLAAPPKNKVPGAASVQTNTSMAFFTRQGLQPASRDVNLSQTLEYRLLGVACRSGALATITSMKEAFLFDLRHLANPHSTKNRESSLRIQFDMRQSSVATVLAVADVNLYVHRDGSKKKSEKKDGKRGGGGDFEETLCSLCLVGDTDGKVHFAVGSVSRGSLQCGSIAAHSSAVRCLLVTGDASRPMWRIGVARAAAGHGQDSFAPHTCPGSAIVSVAADGEVKVWQPVFVSGTTLAARSDQVLSVCRLEWRLAGLFSCQRSAPRSSITAACLDPSCMFLVVGRSDGSAEQWPLPGLVSSSGLQTTQASLWALSRHTGAITDAQVFVHAFDSSMRQVEPPRDTDDDGAEVALASKIVCSVRPSNANASGADKTKTVGYTLDELKALAGSSSLCTCSTDLSLVLWRFLVSKDGADWSGSRWSSTHNSRYLYPFPCRRFVFSSPPSRGLCFPPSAFPESASAETVRDCVWRLGVIVNGIVVTVMQASFNALFQTDTNMLDNGRLAHHRASASPGSLHMMPVVSHVFKPSRTAELLSQRTPADGSHGRFSWQSLDYWREKEGDPVPPQPRLDPNYYEVEAADGTAGGPLPDWTALEVAPHTQRPTITETNIIVPLNPDLAARPESKPAQTRASLAGVRVVVPSEGAEDWLGPTLGPRELEAAMQPGASGAKPRFRLGDRALGGETVPVVAVGTTFADSFAPSGDLEDDHHPFAEFRQQNVPDKGSLEGSQVLGTQPSLDTFSSLLKSMPPLAPAPQPSQRIEELTDDLTDSTSPVGSPQRSPASIRSARSANVSLSMPNDGVIGMGSHAGFGTRSIDIPVDDGTNLRLRRVRGEDGAMSSDIVLNSNVSGTQPDLHTATSAAIEVPFPASETPGRGAQSESAATKTQDQRPDRRSRRDKELEVKQTHAQILRQDLQAKVRARRQAEDRARASKTKTLYVSKSQKDLGDKEKTGMRQVMGSSASFAVPINFSDEAMRQREHKNVVDKTLKVKAAETVSAPPYAAQEAESVEDDLKGDDFYQDPEYHIPNVAAPPPNARGQVRMSKVGIVLQEPAAAAGEGGDESVQAVVQEGDFLADVPTYFDRNAPTSFVYDRKDNARPPRRAFVAKKAAAPGSAGGVGLLSRPGTAPGDAPVEAADDSEMLELMGPGFDAALLSADDGVALAAVLDEFTIADLNVFESLDVDLKLQILREMASSGEEPEEDETPAQRSAAAARRGLVMMKRACIKLKALQSMPGAAAAGKKGLALGGGGGKGVLPAPEILLEVHSYTQKTVRLKFLTGNSSVRLVVFAMRADHEAPLPDSPSIVGLPSVEPASVASGVAAEGSQASASSMSLYSVKPGAARPREKLPTPAQLEHMTTEQLLLLPGVCAGVVMTVKEEDLGLGVAAPGGTVIPSVKPDDGTVGSGGPPVPTAKTVDTAPTAPDEPSDEVTLRNLEPECAYKIYCFLACSSTGRRTFKEMTADELKDAAVGATTLAEVLEVDWALLSDEQRVAEVQAATRSFDVARAAAAEKVPIPLPSDEDLAVVARGDTVSSAGRSTLKRYLSFLAWWAPPDKAFVSHARQVFLMQECLFYCRSHPEGEPEAAVMQAFRATKILSDAEIAALADWTAALPPDYRFPTKRDAVLTPTERIFRRFRSWYCGGFALQDWERQQWEAGPGDAAGMPESGFPGFGGGFARPGAAGGGTGGLFDGSEEGGAAPVAADLAADAGDPSAPASAGFGFEAMTDELQSQEHGPRGFLVDGPGFGTTEFCPVLAARRIVERTACLQQRRAHVDRACSLVLGLVDQYRQADKKGVSEKDLTLRRAMLLQDDLALIMASVKVLQLLVANRLCKLGSKPDLSKLGVPRGELSPAAICGADIFALVGPELLTPEAPPALVLATLPGTTRRPIRAWQLCSEEERLTEVTLAVALDCILGLAVEDGVSVPDPEDIALDKALVPVRARRVADFIAWYAGEEGTDKVPGRGTPTLARVVFAETLEGAVVESDPFVVQTMIGEKLPVPDAVVERHKARGKLEQMLLEAPTGVLGQPAGPSEPSESSEGGPGEGEGKGTSEDKGASEGEGKGEGKGEVPRRATQTPEETELLKVAFDREATDTLRAFYENSLSTTIGLSIRLTLIRRYIDEIISCRRGHMMRTFLPPGPARLSHMMMFPPAGIILPPFELPDFRFRPLFPSRDRETAFTHKEMERWYSAHDLDEDDRLMLDAEQDGQRRAVYLEWLAQEKERQKETRLHMLDEDRLGQQRRAYFSLVQEQLARIDSLQPVETKRDFVLEADLPGSYDYIREETVEFEHGGGLENEDELEDIKLEVQRKLEEKQRREAERRRQQEDDRLRRIAEEEAAQRREEVNQRLIEGIERRRVLREHLQQLQTKRRLEASDKARMLKEAEHDAIEAELHEQERLRIAGKAEAEACARVRDQADMEAEDFFCHELYIALAECALMQHEDILAAMRDVHEARRAEAAAAKRLELEEIYAPFEPFRFEREKIRLPTLHSVLSSYPADAAEFDTLSRERLLGVDAASLSASFAGVASMSGLLAGASQSIGSPTPGADLEASMEAKVYDGLLPSPAQSYPVRSRAPQPSPHVPSSPVTAAPPRQPASILSPLLLQPLLWPEHDTGLDLASRQVAADAESAARAAQEQYEAERFRGGRAERRRRDRAERESTPSAETKDGATDFPDRDFPARFDDPKKAMQAALVHAYRLQDERQRPHTSGSARQFNLFDAAPIEVAKYTLPALDASFNNVFANPWPQQPAEARDGPRAVSAGVLEGTRRGRAGNSSRVDAGASTSWLAQRDKQRPSLESIGTLGTLGTLGSLVNLMTTSIRESSKDGSGISALAPSYRERSLEHEVYLLDLLQGAAREKRGSSRNGGTRGEGSREGSREGTRPPARSVDAHVGWSIVDASASQFLEPPRARPAALAAQTSTDSSGGGASAQLQRVLAQSAQVASAIMQRHTLELQLRQERAAAASLAVLDRRGLSSVALKRAPKLVSTGSLSKRALDAANAITQAYMQSKAGLKEYTHSRSFLEDEFFLATAASTGAGAGEGEAPEGGGGNVFSEGVLLDSSSNVRRRRELLGRVAEELGMVPATGEDEAGAAGDAGKARASWGERTTGVGGVGGGWGGGGAAVLPGLGYPSAYPTLQPSQDGVRKEGERFSRAQRKGLRYTRTPDVPPTESNPRQRPFGVKGGHYTIREFHPKHGLQPLLPHMDTPSLVDSAASLTLSGGGASDEGLAVGEVSMRDDEDDDDDGQSRKSRQSRQTGRSRSPGRGAGSKQRTLAMPPLRVDAYLSGVSVSSANSLDGASLLSGVDSAAASDDGDGRGGRDGRASRGGVVGLDGARPQSKSRSSGRTGRSPRAEKGTDKKARPATGDAGTGDVPGTSGGALMLGAFLDDMEDEGEPSVVPFSPEKSAVSRVSVSRSEREN